MKKLIGKVDFFGYLFSVLSIACLPYFLYLFLQYKTFVENYNLFPVLIGQVIVLPLFCVALSYSLLWWCRKFLDISINNGIVKRCLIAASIFLFIAYYALTAGYLTGWLNLNGFFIFMMEHSYVLFPVGILFYLGLKEKAQGEVERKG